MKHLERVSNLHLVVRLTFVLELLVLLTMGARIGTQDLMIASIKRFITELSRYSN